MNIKFCETNRADIKFVTEMQCTRGRYSCRLFCLLYSFDKSYHRLILVYRYTRLITSEAFHCYSILFCGNFSNDYMKKGAHLTFLVADFLDKSQLGEGIATVSTYEIILTIYYLKWDYSRELSYISVVHCIYAGIDVVVSILLYIYLKAQWMACDNIPVDMPDKVQKLV